MRGGISPNGPAAERLSSRLTPLYKFFVPAMVVFVFAMAGLTLVGRTMGPETPAAVPWVFVGVAGAVIAIIYWSCARIKRVELVGDVFVLSNYLRTIEVPVSDLERASASLFMNPELVWLHFRRPTGFGRVIVFMPPYRFSMRFSRHPLAERLNERVVGPRPIA